MITARWWKAIARECSQRSRFTPGFTTRGPDVIAAAHAHSMYGKAWSSLGRLLDPITQDSCAFYEDHGLFADFTRSGVREPEGERIAQALGPAKAAILCNHGLLTVGQSVDEAAWWFITMDRSCQAQLLAEAAGEPLKIAHETATPRAHRWEATWWDGSNSSRSSPRSLATSPTSSNSIPKLRRSRRQTAELRFPCTPSTVD